MNNMDIDEYLREIVKLSYEYRDTVDLKVIATVISENLCEYYHYSGDIDTVYQKVYQLLVDNKDNSDYEKTIYLIKSDVTNIVGDSSKSDVTPTETVDANVGNTLNTPIPSVSPSSGSASGGGSRRSASTKGSNTKNKRAIIDVDEASGSQISNLYDNILNEVKGLKVDIKSTVSLAQSKADALKQSVENSKLEVEGHLEEIKKSMKEYVDGIGQIDGTITPGNDEDVSFTELWQKAKIAKSNTKLVLAGEAVFNRMAAKNSNIKIKDGVVTIETSNKIFKYNYKTKELTVTTSYKNGKPSVTQKTKVNIYVPQGAEDFTKLNTITNIITNKYNSRKHPEKSDCILIQPVYNGQKTIIADATRFLNKAAGVNSSANSKKVQNTIMGGSQWGAQSLQIAAKTNDLYQNVVCVNNALIVKGVNSTSGEKSKFSSLKDLDGLAGKNIYFVSAANDPNLTWCSGKDGAFTPCGIGKGYVYSGAKVLLDHFKNNKKAPQVYMVTNNYSSGAKNSFTKLADSYKNFHYSTDMWNKINLPNQKEHAYEGIIKQFIRSELLSYNAK